MQMHAELQVLSPLVPIREVLFLRFCKQHAEGLWAVVDVSVDAILRPDGGNHHSHHHHAQNGSGATGYMGCRLLPTGCIVQDMSNGYSKVRTPPPPGRYHGCAPPLSDSTVVINPHGAAACGGYSARVTPAFRAAAAQYFMLPRRVHVVRGRASPRGAIAASCARTNRCSQERQVNALQTCARQFGLRAVCGVRRLRRGGRRLTRSELDL